MTESDYASDSEIPEWVQDYVRYQRRLIHPPRGDMDWDYFERLNKKVAQIIQRVDSALASELAEKARPLNLQKLLFIPVYSLDRRSQWVRNIDGGTDENSYFLFDCLHGATLRTLYYLVTIGAAQEQIMNFLKEHIASCLLYFDNEVEALALLDEKILDLPRFGRHISVTQRRLLAV